MRTICDGDGMVPEIVAEIDRRLNGVIADHAVAMPWAIESGSRAWGFPSPDSDYDCRFVFVRRQPAYLSLFEPRDVIETPLTPVFDVNGWDVGKAIRLMVKGNAVIVEWLTSPIVYRGDGQFRDRFLDLAGIVMRRDSVARHYLGLAQGMCARTMADPERTKLKALFYVLRPLFALRWLRAHTDQSIAPMNFQALMSGIEIEAAVRDEIAALLAVKAVTHELGTGPVPPAIRAFIEGEFAIAAEALPSQRPLAPDAVLQADAFYRWAIDRYGGPA